MTFNYREVRPIDDEVSHSETAVGTSSVTVAAANEGRRGILLINDSDTAIYVNLGGTAVANEGIRINANGGSVEFSETGGPHYQGAINAISTVTNKNLLVTEW